VVDTSAIFAGQSNYTLDGIHPNDYGNSQMLNAIIAAIH
jgi:lysophospholipase L1-like esterase